MTSIQNVTVNMLDNISTGCGVAAGAALTGAAFFAATFHQGRNSHDAIAFAFAAVGVSFAAVSFGALELKRYVFHTRQPIRQDNTQRVTAKFF